MAGKIYIASKPVGPVSVNPMHHLYIVYSEDGDISNISKLHVIRGGYQYGGISVDNLVIEIDTLIRESMDDYGSGETYLTRGTTELNIGSQSADIVWEKMKLAASNIGSSGSIINHTYLSGGTVRDTGLDYEFTDINDATNNSNAVIRSILAATGIILEDNLIPQVDYLTDTPGQDTILAGSSNDTLLIGSGVSYINGDLGIDTADFSHSEKGIKVSLNNEEFVYLNPGSLSKEIKNVENIIGTAFNDTITDDGSTNEFSGAAGNDIFIKNGTSIGLDNDIFNGGKDGMSLSVDGQDTINYNAFNKALHFILHSNYNYTVKLVNPGFGTENADTLISIENIIGTRFADKFLFGQVDDNIRINGGSGMDVADFSLIDDDLDIDLRKTDTSIINKNILLKNIDRVIGTQFNNEIHGDDNGNILDGFGGFDDLYGGAGADTFIWRSSYVGTVTIHNWDSSDVIKLDGITIADLQDKGIYIGSDGYFFSDNGTLVIKNLKPNKDDPIRFADPHEDDDNWGDSPGAPPSGTEDPAEGPEDQAPEDTTPPGERIAAPDLIPDEEDDPNDPQNAAPPAVANPAKIMGHVPQTYSPLIIDMDGDGVEMTSLEQGAVFWDIDNDGFAEKSAWVKGDDALLAIDLNEDGIINNHDELFGTGTTDGFTVLSAYDSNNDGVIDSQDTDFNRIIVWQDLNQDGFSQYSEMKSLMDAGIASINLNADRVDYTLEGNKVTHASTVTLADNSTRTIVDAWFRSDNLISKWMGSEDTEIDMDAFGLPELRGYGDVKNLFMEMSDNEELLEKVQEVSDRTLAELLDPDYDFTAVVKEILFDWARVSELQAANTQTAEEVRIVEFMDTIMGLNLYTGGELVPYGNTQSTFFQQQVVKQVWIEPYNYFLGTFAAQTAFKDIFNPGLTYSASEGIVKNFTGLSYTELTSIKSTIDAGTDRLYNWSLIVRVIEGSVGVNNLDQTDYAFLDGLIRQSLPDFSLSTLYHVITHNISDDFGASHMDHVLSGTGSDDTLIGITRDSILIGGDGNDILYGSAGNDVYIGGAGDDHYIDQGLGYDAYIYQGGHDTVTDLVSSSDAYTYGDEIVFERGITLADLSIERRHTQDSDSTNIWGQADLYIHVTGYGSITVHSQYDVDNQVTGIDRLVFGDNSELQLKHLDDIVYGTNGNDVLTGLDRAYYLSDRLNGGLGDDILNGGLGVNQLSGESGNDTYVYGGGMDIITESAGMDSIVFDSSYDPNLFTFTAGSLNSAYDNNSYAINILYNGVLKAIIKDALLRDHNFVEKLVVTGKSEIDLYSLSWDQYGTSGNDTLYSYGNLNLQNQSLYGMEGNDLIYGGDGDDYLDGGVGDDFLYGGHGDDTLTGGPGNDYIDGQAGDDTVIYNHTASNSFSSSYRGGSGNDKLVLNFTTAQFTTAVKEDILAYYDHIASNNNTASAFGTPYIFTTLGLDAADFEQLEVYVDDVLFDLEASAVIEGTNGDDILTGNARNNTLIGKDGNDTLDGGMGKDTLIGGSGNDIYIVDRSDDIVLENANEGIDHIHASASYQLGDNVENLTLTGTAFINGTGNALDNIIHGNAGNNRLDGGAGSDTLYAGAGNDTAVFRLSENSGASDAYYGGEGFDTLELHFTQLEYTTAVEAEVLAYYHYILDPLNKDIHASTGSEFAFTTFGLVAGRFETLRVFVDNNEILFEDPNAVSGDDTNNTIMGDEHDNYLMGLSGDDTIYGYAGNDTLIGGSGSDYLMGGEGDDTYIFARDFYTSSPDVIYEATNEGMDTIRFTNGILESEIYSWTDSYGNFWLQLGDDEYNRRITASGSTSYSAVTPTIEKIVYSDGHVTDLTNGLILKDTSAGHQINGSMLNDIIDGRGGDDHIYGYAGNDTLIGGSGSDYLVGGEGDDTYVFARDFYSGYQDTIHESANEGTDTIQFTDGITESEVFTWTDSYGNLYLQLGDDEYERKIGVTGSTSYNGVTLTIERIAYSDGHITDLTNGLILKDTSADHQIQGSTLNDVIDGRGGNDNIYGYAGNDILIGGSGSDYLAGGEGDDTYIFARDFYSSHYDVIYESTNEGIDAITFTDGILESEIYSWTDNYGALWLQLGDDTLEKRINITGGSFYNGISLTVENITFSDGQSISLTNGLNLKDTSADHQIYGTLLDDVIDGRGGNDSLYGYAGNDILIGGSGSDYLVGGEGDDTYIFDRDFYSGYQDIIYETANEGSDTIKFIDGIKESEIYSWTDYQGSLWLQLDDDTQERRIQVSGGTLNANGIALTVEHVTFGEGYGWDHTLGLTLNDTSASHTLLGSALNDVINGNAGNDTIYGYDGNDTLIGGTGNDYLAGGEGNDAYFFGKNFSSPGGYDQVDETSSEGFDTIYLTDLVSDDIISWVDNNGDFWIQSEKNPQFNTLKILSGNSSGTATGIERIVFSDNEVWNFESKNGFSVQGTRFNDTLYGTSGNNKIRGGWGDDYIYGLGGNDILKGDLGNDHLFGGSGNDTLYGGSGHNYMVGGAGADIFAFQKKNAFKGINTIEDFNPSEGDSLYILSLLRGYTHGESVIDDYISFVTHGNNTSLIVDSDGAGFKYNPKVVAVFLNTTDLDIHDLLNQNLIY